MRKKRDLVLIETSQAENMLQILLDLMIIELFYTFPSDNYKIMRR